MWRLIYFIPAWIVFTAIQFPLLLLGLILIPLIAKLKRYEVRKSKVFDKDILSWKDKWMWPWGNEEDSILNGAQYYDAGSTFKQIVYWSAVRNPVNNLRYTPILSLKIESDKVEFIGSNVADIKEYDHNIEMWYLCWHGIYSNLRVQTKIFGSLWRFWIGWKIYPEDSIRPVVGHRVPGAGVAYQIKKLDESRTTQ